jgi:hypothetical protein
METIFVLLGSPDLQFKEQGVVRQQVQDWIPNPLGVTTGDFIESKER